MNRQPVEFDIVAESTDRKYILIGECKWAGVKHPGQVLKTLGQKANLFPLAKDRKIITALSIKETTEEKILSNVFLPSDVLARLK